MNCSNFFLSWTLCPPSLICRRETISGIQVRDEGTGIPEKNLKQIFDPYFTTKPKGSGLGLATTYSIIKNHGESHPASNRSWAAEPSPVYLPAACHQRAPVETRCRQGRPITGSGRVLIVDDEEPIRELVTYT